MVNKKKEDILKELRTFEDKGLSIKEADGRLKNNGTNELVTKKKTLLIVRFLTQFKDMLVIVLLLAALINVLVAPDDWVQAIIILTVVLINAIIGIVQENKAEKALDALKKLSSPQSKVIRDKNTIIIDSKDIVVGDILILEAGDFVPADGRIIENYNMKVDESPLTGESVPVDKSDKELENVTSLGDMKNMVFSSTFVTYGRGKVVVTATAMDTEIGKIATLLNEESAKLTPLQVKLNQIGKMFAILAIVISLITIFIQLLNSPEFLETLRSDGLIASIRHEQFMNAMMTAIALAVAAIPEGMAAIVTIILSIGVSRMVKQNAIIKKLPAVETLGCTSIVCSDKTGTLTQNKMTVVKIFENDKAILTQDLKDKSLLISYFAICCDALVNEVDGKEVAIGDPTETALIYAQKAYGKLDISNIKRIKEIPFDSDRKLMSVVVKIDNRFYAITKGAPDVMFKMANSVSKEAINENSIMAKEALRVIAVSIKEVEENIKLEDIEKNLNFAGLLGMIDPERPEVKDAISIATKAGIKTIMITGDHVVTAQAIANKLGIFKDGDLCVTSEELQKMSDEQLGEEIEKISVYARVAPSDKVRIVKAWQKKGKIVSMTGDGVNDAPSLKAADIGCAMGITGTDVSKEASEMILTDDNFATIIKAVEEGRNIYENIGKTVKFIISGNIGEILVIFLASVISLMFSQDYGLPLLPIHLLWVNLVTDTLPAFALGMENPNLELMNKKPRNKDESFFANGVLLEMIMEGIFIAFITLTAFFIGLNHEGIVLGQTMAFFTLSTTQLFHAFNKKSSTTVLNKKLFNNKWLIYAFIICMFLNLVVIFTPLRNLFELQLLSFGQFIFVLLLASSSLFVIELVKVIQKSMRKNNSI